MKEKTQLTMGEISILIHTVQRAIIDVEQWNRHEGGFPELIRKYRLLLCTLISMEKELLQGEKREPIEVYK